MSNKNLMLWDKVCKTPKEKTKQVTQGRKIYYRKPSISNQMRY